MTTRRRGKMWARTIEEEQRGKKSSTAMRRGVSLTSEEAESSE
jgi:hypothetical protein